MSAASHILEAAAFALSGRRAKRLPCRLKAGERFYCPACNAVCRLTWFDHFIALNKCCGCFLIYEKGGPLRRCRDDEIRSRTAGAAAKKRAWEIIVAGLRENSSSPHRFLAAELPTDYAPEGKLPE